MSECFHCNDSDQCSCAFCGYYGTAARGLVWLAGACGFCAGRAAFDKLRQKLDELNIDPRDIQYWTFDKDGHRVFDPFGELRAAQHQLWERERQSQPHDQKYSDLKQQVIRDQMHRDNRRAKTK